MNLVIVSIKKIKNHNNKDDEDNVQSNIFTCKKKKEKVKDLILAYNIYP